MLTVIERIKQEQEDSLLRIRNHIMSGFRDLLFGETAASLHDLAPGGTVDFAEEPRTQPSARIELPPLAKVMDRTGSLRRKGPWSKRHPDALAKLTRDLRACIEKNPNLRIEQIAEKMGESTKDLALPVRKLLTEKSITKRGERRGTTYRVRA